MIEVLLTEEYGFLPKEPESLTFENLGGFYPSFCAGNADCDRIIAKCVINGKEFSFPFFATVPKDKKNVPFFIHINFRPDVPDRLAHTGEEFFEGDIGYHLRRGTHYFSRQDWLKLIKFVKMHFSQ